MKTIQQIWLMKQFIDKISLIWNLIKISTPIVGKLSPKINKEINFYRLCLDPKNTWNMIEIKNLWGKILNWNIVTIICKIVLFLDNQGWLYIQVPFKEFRNRFGFLYSRKINIKIRIVNMYISVLIWSGGRNKKNFWALRKYCVVERFAFPSKICLLIISYTWKFD